MKIIALLSAKGGVGKTTTAVNLAALCARAGKATLLIDLDPQGASGHLLRIRPAEGLKAKRFWSGKADINELIRASDVEGLDVLPAAIPVAEVVEESAVARSSVALHAPRARVAQAYRRLHAEVEVILAGQDAA